MEGAGCNTTIDWTASPLLRKLKIDLQNIRAKADTQYHLGKRVAEILQTVQTSSLDGMRELEIKGHLTSSLSYALGSLTSLRSLTLLCGSTLTPRLLLEIASFPHMEDLRLQTTQVDTDWCHTASDPMTLPSLRNLRLQSTHSVMQTILDLLQPSTIEHLHLEAHGPALEIKEW